MRKRQAHRMTGVGHSRRLCPFHVRSALPPIVTKLAVRRDGRGLGLKLFWTKPSPARCYSNSLDEMRARGRGLKSVGEILRFVRH
jgi:hypothetical protein